MKILFAVSKLKNGGAERVVAILANKLVESGYEVGIVTLEGDEVAYSIDQNIKYMPIAIGGNRYTRRLKRIFRARKVIKEFHPDLIFSFLDRISFSIIPANIGINNKLVLVIRNDPRNNDMSKGIKKNIRDFLFPKADYFVFQTVDERDYFAPTIRERSTVIKNPISESMPEPWQGEHKKEIIGVGRLEPQKNWPMLLTAFEKFAEKHPEYTLAIYGEGPLREKLQAQIDNSAILNNRASLPGFVYNIYDVMNKSGIFVLPSNFEGLSNAMLEAMALGIPTICTDCPAYGAREVIKDGENGILIATGDVTGLTEKLIEIADNKDLANKLSQNSIKIRQELSLNVIIEQWKNVIESVLSQ